MGGRGSAYIKHTKSDDNKFKPSIELIDDPETEYHNEMFDELKKLKISTRKSTDVIDDKILERQQKQVINIVSKYNSIFEATTKDRELYFQAENISDGALAYCGSSINEKGSIVQRVVIDTKQYKTYDKIVEVVEDGINKKWFVPINTRFKSRDYVITHEFGHAVENSIFEKIKVERKLDNINLKGFTNTFATKIKNEVIEIWKNKYTTGNIDDKIELSKYSEKNDREWFAETFTNLELADKPKPIALALGEYIRRYL